MFATRHGPRAGFVVFGLMLTLALGASARAQPRSPIEGRYLYSAEFGKGTRDGTFTFTSTDKDDVLNLSVVDKGKSGDVTWVSSATVAGRVVTARRSMTTTGGVARAVAGSDQGSGAEAFEYVAVFADDWKSAGLKIYRVDGDARTEIGKGSLHDKQPWWDKVPGDLLALAKKTIDDYAHQPRNVFNKDFALDEYVHLGVTTSVQWMKDSERTALMKEQDRQFRAAGKGEPVWIRTIVQGGPQVDVSRSVPLGPAPAPSLFAGLHAGATASYTVEDQSARPENVKDVERAAKLVLDVPAKVIQLPFNASHAEELTMGARRIIETDAEITISGGITYGYDLADLGLVPHYVDLTGEAGARLFYSVKGQYRIEVERESAKLVRLRWTKVSSRERGFGIWAAIGLAPTGISPSVLESGVTAAISSVKDYTVVRFDIDRDKLDEQRFFAELEFDLNDPIARQCYDDCVLGNFAHTQDLGREGNARGVTFGRWTSTLTDKLSFSAKFKAFKILHASSQSWTTQIHAVVDDLDGRRTTTDDYLYEKKTQGLFGGRRSMLADSLERTVLKPDATTPERGARASFRFNLHQSHTSRADMDSAVRLGEVLFGAATVAQDKERIQTSRPDDKHPPSFGTKVIFPEHGDEYGKSDLSLLVELDDQAIVEALSANEETFYAAYGSAYVEGQQYDWTPERRKFLLNMSLVPDKNESEAKRKVRYEAWDVRDAVRTWKSLSAARAAGPTQKRAEIFRNIAKVDGFQMHAVVALSVLAADRSRHELSMTARGASFSFAAGKPATVPGEDRLPLPGR